MKEYAVYDKRTRRYASGFGFSRNGVITWDKEPGDTFEKKREANIARNRTRDAFFEPGDPKREKIIVKEVE